MVTIKSTSRFSSIENLVILTQTDTTVGFVSQNADKLYEIKSRDTLKPFIKVYTDFKSFLACGNRIPHAKKNFVRRSKKTSFIVKNRAFRVAKIPFSWVYSTSANESNQKFDRTFCEDKADIIMEDKRGFSEENSSTLFKINNSKEVKIR